MSENGKHGPIIRRRLDIGAVETRRLEKGLTVEKLCAKAKVDPGAYRNLLRHEGEHSRDAVLMKVLGVLDLAPSKVLTFETAERVAS